ncbi:MAG: hypothetical protein IJP32_03025, partial [Clostridia bacterium]|nr:hypothetical protein [Clostridia bacterium]
LLIYYAVPVKYCQLKLKFGSLCCLPPGGNAVNLRGNQVVRMPSSGRKGDHEVVEGERGTENLSRYIL